MAHLERFQEAMYEVSEGLESDFKNGTNFASEKEADCYRLAAQSTLDTMESDNVIIIADRERAIEDLSMYMHATGMSIDIWRLKEGGE